MIDTHCHLTYAGLIERVDLVVQAAVAAGVGRMISIGTSPTDASNAVALAQRLAPVYAAVGLHPHYAAQADDRAAFLATMQPLLKQPKVVAIGEMGLDRHYPDPPLDVQRRALECQLELMTFTEFPGVIHNREATDDTLAMLRTSGLPGGRFVFHCFTGSDAELDKILDFGAFIGITGIATFKNSARLAASACRVPLDRLLIETDSPYLTPEPHRKIKTNEPRFVIEVARFLAQKRGLDFQEFARQIDANAARFFRLPFDSPTA